ncbi:Zn(2+) transporter ZRG17 NDAI_0K02310 [Naumovozyma dairenensis CBS 421]|uniref:Protein ZRG17 n=1 Tax=Naumovozyma dairenensis (strain ATCC 10597 / BCRC 20456 / CBS 421 / NBRC 0211 / NRRL Y-12639) TaxID=1071378 RepID=G0WI11_NAUDC|nr:hypothetical protein NDAI_0K02310 [Naumovozyma dairenensis CBS 421]CCD27422.1 hypothetical protein NDAI_0K02310 [Naumovozyma dairenensis CBS 421]
MDGSSDPRFRNDIASTPPMNAIQEEESPMSSEPRLFTQIDDTNILNRNGSNRQSSTFPVLNSSNLELAATEYNNANNNINGQVPLSQTRPIFASPPSLLSRPNSAFYSNGDGNNSSSSIIYNPSFTFGENVPPKIQQQQQPHSGTPPTSKNSTNSRHDRHHRRQSLKYIPGNKLPTAPPLTRSKSPTRLTPSDVISPSKRSSLILDSPFDFTSTSSLAPQLPQQNQTSRASFRKGHRYKHSSVSMNFFQEPEVKIPLNIAKSLPIPNFKDLLKNLPWPKSHFQLLITSLQMISCIVTFQIGHSKSWNNFITLSHFITYDILGSLVIIFVESLSQFEVWSTGTITFPFGLNRMDVLLSFALAVSLCFVGLDLLFHILEEFIAIFVEATSDINNLGQQHDEIASQIPHSHHSSIDQLSLSGEHLKLWYLILSINLFLATLSLYKIFYANKNSKLKTKNPVITITYTLYLLMYPLLVINSFLFTISDFLATFSIAIFILIHGLTIAEWTSTILLMGFSTTTLSGLSLLHVEDTKIETKKQQVRQRSRSTLPIAVLNSNKSSITSHNDGMLTFTFLNSIFKWGKNSQYLNKHPSAIKSLIKEQIENLPEFKSRCHLDYKNLNIIKVNFNLYVVLIKLLLKGGSNDDELLLRIAIDKCIRRNLESVETTIEIDRV